MPLSNTSTWDQSPPVRPGLSDITGGTKANRPGKAPNPVTQPCAEEDNQRAKQITAMAGIVPMALLYVTFPGSVPTISSIRAMGTNVLASDFTAIDNAAGDTTIHWAATTLPILPTPWSAPVANQVDDTEIDRVRAFYTTSGIPAGRQGVRVKTKLGASGTDAAVVVTLF